MPPKRKAKAATGVAKVRKPNDWRAPLFYWRGFIDEGGGWKGTWVASEQGLPCDADFDESPTTFSLMSDKKFGGAGSASFVKGSYKLDQGDGLKSYSDLSHAFHMLSSEGIVGACGTTEFGRFISLGLIEPYGSATRLTLVRRYIADNDPRSQLSAAQIAHLPRLGCKAPWEDDLPWKVAAGWKPEASCDSGRVAAGARATGDPDSVAVPSFIGSSFNTKVEYDAWLDNLGLEMGDRLPSSVSLNVLARP
eukprot:CAMPEP_0115836704 /NCGR_PEP_ID=MMETSP0287-20121206/4847_1 /TAXON_ID=412157 /ORGANISM="Chrysochromulina rotalis, Strain UIO044" /LENGTH=249 /DNA_ID=CAMNT_0003290201 /DNA_START=17 /DNA_END=766 /DNA_ORIENTATION=-